MTEPFNYDAEDYELDCYYKILDYFQKEKGNREQIEIWKYRSFIELMKLLDRTKNRTFVTNAIILILSLFEDIPPDTYNNRGVNINRIKDRTSLISVLKEEFLPN
jgi:hypothetical protein